MWHHTSEPRPGQSAPRDFTARSFAYCAGVVSYINTQTEIDICPQQGVDKMTDFIVFLQAGVCWTVVAEYVLRGTHWELYCQRDSSSSHITGNQEACVSILNLKLWILSRSVLENSLIDPLARIISCFLFLFFVICPRSRQGGWCNGCSGIWKELHC